MAKYRIPELDLATRIMLAVEMLMPIPQRAWGRATELAKANNISPRFSMGFGIEASKHWWQPWRHSSPVHSPRPTCWR